MRAAHAACAALIPLFGSLIVELGLAMQGKPVDWLAVGPAFVGIVTGIIAVFLPAAQLAIPGVVPPANKLDMPVAKP